MSIVSGTIGAIMGSEATGSAASAQADATRQSSDTQAAVTRDIANKQLALQEKMYNQNRADFAPYQGLGSDAVREMRAWKDQSGPAPNYQDIMGGLNYADAMGGLNYADMRKQLDFDKEYTQKLGDYKQSQGFQAQNALAQDAYAEELQKRGLGYGASAAKGAAELEQKLTAIDYDKFRNELANRYGIKSNELDTNYANTYAARKEAYGAALQEKTNLYKAKQAEFATKRDLNQNEYNQILDRVKVGQGAANSTGQANNTYAQQVSSALSGMNTSLQNSEAQRAAGLSAAYGNQGAAQANLWSGLGAQSASAAGTGLKAYDYGQKAGWWGKNSGAANAGTAYTAGSMAEGSGMAGMNAEQAAAYFA